ncbi:MAG: DNA alkylation repair protein [Candidatus Thioglobus sp.]|uniref:DNA alkylation repair protein n=1 Tax=Candidatus Thioglobus sp. TaxID=2026721 RepID=UPI002632E6B7|nr:DNA alkylation repair protein [Candidatus Thioglobus sp.]MDC9727190.1 DNA alkylation repair protein [Candidatus Thioglobus sp.]
MKAKEIIDELKTYASTERKKINEWFFKTGPGQYSEHDQFIGVRVPHTRTVAKKHFNDIALVQLDQLINHPIHEVRHCGLIMLVNKYQSGDKDQIFNYYLDNIHAANNWDLVDTTIPHTIGDYLLNHQNKLSILFNFAKSSNLWQRRIAIVATYAFIKNNQFKPTLDIAKLLLNDSHDLIHKATGWMLREIYKKDNEVCKTFLRQNYAQLPRTTLRYAIERMQEDERLHYLSGEF